MLLKFLISSFALVAATNAAALTPRGAGEIIYMTNCWDTVGFHHSEIDWYPDWQASQHLEVPTAISTAMQGDGGHLDFVKWEGAPHTAFFNDGNFVEVHINFDGQGGTARNKQRGFTCFRDSAFGRLLYQQGSTECHTYYFCT